MNQRVKELIFKVANKLGSDVKTYQSDQGLETLSLMISFPNGRNQGVLALEVAGNEYVRFVSIVKFYANSQDLKTNLNLEKVLRANFQITEGAYGIIDLPSPYGNSNAPALVFVANQNIKTADLEEIENKIISTTKFADQLEGILGGGVDNF